MFQKSDIETILKINGVSPKSSQDEIRLVLQRASYSEAEIEAALSLLESNTTTFYEKNTELNKIFRTTEALKPAEISSLLGIEVKIAGVNSVPSKKVQEMSLLQTLIVVVMAITLAAFGVLGAMYFYEVGVFHPTVSAFGNSK